MNLQTPKSIRAFTRPLRRQKLASSALHVRRDEEIRNHAHNPDEGNAYRMYHIQMDSYERNVLLNETRYCCL